MKNYASVIVLFSFGSAFPLPQQDSLIRHWLHPSLLCTIRKFGQQPPITSSKLLFCKLWSFKAQHHNPGSSAGKEDPSSIPGSERTPGEDIGYPHQYSWASLVAQLVKNPPAIWRPGFDPWFGKIPWRREQLPTPVFWPGEFRGLYSPCGCKELDMTFTLCFVYSHTL